MCGACKLQAALQQATFAAAGVGLQNSAAAAQPGCLLVADHKQHTATPPEAAASNQTQAETQMHALHRTQRNKYTERERT